jgi:hypothetical protein
MDSASDCRYEGPVFDSCENPFLGAHALVFNENAYQYVAYEDQKFKLKSRICQPGCERCWRILKRELNK